MGAATAVPLDAETRATHADHDALRLWLRLFTCSTLIERGIRARLRERFGITLARFDFLAQLARAPAGLRMQELSRLLMVTGGNVTGLTRELAAEGLVERHTDAADRRVQVIRLTSKGRRSFDVMAAEHERWVVERLAGLDRRERAELHASLARLKSALAAGEPTHGSTA
jgi:DNA-binding MarR family transcriptional regulator